VITEGIGLRAPAPVVRRLTEGDLQVLWREMKKRSELRKYQHKPSTWSNALLTGVHYSGVGFVAQHERPILVGFVGEWAVCQEINSRFPSLCSVDFAPRANGDGGCDLKPFGLTIQIKTAVSADAMNLVRIRDEYGRRKPITARVLCFCQWDESRCTYLRGWVFTRDVKHLPEVPARRGKHWNIEIPTERLSPISALHDELNARREFFNGNH
jgi:hypothetical protein